jgi:diguanylate cyclase (GGDEF)-like protein
MKNKKNIVIVLCAIVCLVLGGIYFFTKQDKNTSFTILEKQWLESNKSKVIDISILKDIPVISYNGSGILFDFLNDFEEVTGLDFNPVAYQKGDEIKNDYSFQVVSQKGENDVLVYSDSYALLTTSSVKYNKLTELDGMTIGVLESDLESAKNATDGISVTFKTYTDIDALIGALDSKTNEDGSVSNSEVDSAMIPKISNYNLILSKDNLNISYNINEIKQDYVIRLGNDEKLNEIITKYFNKWKELKYNDSFNRHFSSNYFTFSKLDDKSKVDFKSKRYSYGYIDNRPYDAFVNEKYYGINKEFLEEFSDIADIDIDYKNYSDLDSLIIDFNDNKIDIIFDNYDSRNYNSSVSLVSNYDEKVVVLALPTNKVTVSSVKSLVGNSVATLSNTRIASYLEEKGVEVKTYSSISEMLDKVKDDVVIVLDSEVYNFYSSKLLNEYKNIYLFDMSSEYSFKVYDNEINKVFINFFNFYLSFVSNQEISNVGYSELVNVTATSNYVTLLIIFIIIVVVFLTGFLIYQGRRNVKENKVVVVKDSKIKYIDVLTSLKNRNYLNDNIDEWDESLVYPQGIVIVDLNNIAYINDNYGHAEGDKVIKEAANILIKTQISNTEIIRTNGNEFLIYMVGYDEKQIVSYIRKLSKDLRDLSHDFGAAIGYSIITDEIKTIDDAINEATMDMKNNKQESR